MGITLLAGTSWPASVWANEPPTAAELKEAREQFTRGRKLEDEGKFAEALALFQSVGQVKMTPQVRFHIALCLEHTGKLVDALETFRIAAREATSTAPNVVAEANQHIDALEKRVPTLTVLVAKGHPGDAISLDGRPVTAGSALRVDPGGYAVTLRRDGAVVSEQRVTLEEGKSLRVELAATPGGEGSGPSAPFSLQRTLGWTAVGVSAASLVTMGVFIGLRSDRLSKVEAACPTLTNCDPSVAPIANEGATYATLVNVFAGLSGAAAVAGVALLLTAPAPAPSAPSAGLRLNPVFAPGVGFVSVEGRF
ncbi:hypothetical protein [Polyangium jinanense]|uniref:PEGA domain-containing protein n=1 Tax=Polyangium jinanense TaxID=2829994 RepID=A0A9X3XBS1_9BACT|nr:hypothetical protein [Polyangium jinanense]MDC3960759.1 hypothetical protein [Polyangium jinanense]MDC3985863.1 hypothetical protein [Polyangium jinanense]